MAPPAPAPPTPAHLQRFNFFEVRHVYARQGEGQSFRKERKRGREIGEKDIVGNSLPRNDQYGIIVTQAGRRQESMHDSVKFPGIGPLVAHHLLNQFCVCIRCGTGECIGDDSYRRHRFSALFIQMSRPLSEDVWAPLSFTLSEFFELRIMRILWNPMHGICHL